MSEDLHRLLGSLRSEGAHDSPGRFTYDLVKGREKLARYQLEEPQSFILKVLSSAVKGRASFLCLDDRAGPLRVDWDGAGLTPEELSHLFDSLLVGGSSAQQDLALALLNAGRRGDWEFHTDHPEGRVILRNLAGETSLAVAPGSGRGPHQLWLHPRRRGLWRFLSPGRTEASILKASGRFAPLRLEVNGRVCTGPWELDKVFCLRQLGRPPLELSAPSAFQVAPLSGWDDWPGLSGYLWLDPDGRRVCWRDSYRRVQLGLGYSLLIQDGLAHAFLPGFFRGLALLYVQGLPVDFSGIRLVASEPLARLGAWVRSELEALLLEQAALPPASFRIQFRHALQQAVGRSRLGQVPVIRMADGQRAGLGEVRGLAQYHGFLAVARSPYVEGYPPCRVALAGQPVVELAGLRTLAVDHLTGPARWPELEEPLLVRQPLALRRGEIGLILGRPRQGWRLRYPAPLGDHWWEREPRGVRLSLEEGASLEQLDGELASLYWTLTRRKPAHNHRWERRWASDHLLEFLFFLGDRLVRRQPVVREAPLKHLLDLGARDGPELLPGLAPEVLRDLVRGVELSQAKGTTLSLRALTLSVEHPCACYADDPPFGQSNLEGSALLLGPGQRHRLQALLGPRHELTPVLPPREVREEEARDLSGPSPEVQAELRRGVTLQRLDQLLTAAWEGEEGARGSPKARP